MMKPILLVSALALAAPALAQSNTTGTATGTTTQTNTTGTATGPNDDIGAVGGNTVNTQNSTQNPTRMPLDGDEEDSSVDHSAMGHTSTSTGADTDTMTTAGATGMTGQTSAWNNSSAVSGQTMANWNFGGDWGEIGSADWGVGAGTAMAGNMSPGVSGAASGLAAPTYTGVGGPIDVASQWSTISPRGGDLTPLEFGLWVLEQNGKDVDRQVEATRRSRASHLPAIQVLNVTAGALAQADTNGDWRVSQSELQAFAGM
jgi:hypothetical protein